MNVCELHEVPSRSHSASVTIFYREASLELSLSLSLSLSVVQMRLLNQHLKQAFHRVRLTTLR
jgi:hypothetical protein